MAHSFDWLVDEIAQIKTPKFHVVEGPASEELREAIRRADVPVPPSYVEFVLRFGNAKLYRLGNRYQVEIYAGPREAETDDGKPLIQFGRTDMGLCYFNDELLQPGEESPVFEWTGPDYGLEETAIGFERWLRWKALKGRRLYGRDRWREILAGPAPFSARELAIVAARRKYTWRVVGIADNHNVVLEVANGSDLELAFLSVAVKRRGEIEPFGGVVLSVAHIPPGAVGVVEVDCYKDLIGPQNVELTAEPDPGPEDRDQYREMQ